MLTGSGSASATAAAPRANAAETCSKLGRPGSAAAGASAIKRLRPRRMPAWYFLRWSAEQKSGSASFRASEISFPQ
jgi:hypothetical protein